MKKSWLTCGFFLIFSSLASASPSLISGTPNYFGFGLSPAFGQLISFDDLADAVSNSATGSIVLPGDQYMSLGVNSISNAGAPLLATTFSQQSAPVYLTTGAADNYAGDITISLAKAAGIIGIGILSDDTTPVTLTALGANGTVLASFNVLTSASGATPENGYWAIRDLGNDIQALRITSAANLGIDDLQFAFAPEPGSLALLGAGVLLMVLGQLRRRAQ